ncbi:MAG: TraR/DksA family transcriptional regulator, partial [Acidipropionibacterium jensenii]|nr:TraR/DksA family transcriptional regulator [Acidipropionibacterium jensenii]
SMDDALDPSALQAARERLGEAREEALRRWDSVQSRVEDLRRDRAEEPADDEHDPDGPTLSSEWTMAEAQRGVVESAIAEIDAALARVEDGRYGLCLRCGRPISPERLAARPSAATCLDCARRASRSPR